MITRFVRIAVIPIYLFVTSVSVAFTEDTVTCESNNYRYHYCRVRTEGRVSLDREYSRSRCSYGSSWGYDSRGIWVDHGCRARFEVGDDDHSWDDDDHDSDGTAAAIGAAVAVIGGAILLGTIFNSSGSPAPSVSTSSTEPWTSEAVPSWAIGTFAGFNSIYNTELEMTIDPTGLVKLNVDKEQLQGTFSHGRIVMLDGGELDVYQDDSGIKTIRRDAPESVVRYVRIR